MRTGVLLFFYACCALTSAYQSKSAPLLKEKPEWLKVCRKDDPKLGECFNQLFFKMFPHLAVGIPEINVDPFEPLPLDSVSVSKGSGPVTLTGSLHDMSVGGPSNATPTYTQVDFGKEKLNFGIHLPILDIKSKYNLKGKILVLPLVGSGECEILLKDVRTNVLTEIKFKKVEDKEILHFEKMRVNFKVKAMKVDFRNLFNGNRVLGLTMNNFVNQNAQEVLAELEDNISENLSEILLQLINNVFSKIPTEMYLIQGGENEEIENDKKTDNVKETENQEKLTTATTTDTATTTTKEGTEDKKE